MMRWRSKKVDGDPRLLVCELLRMTLHEVGEGLRD
jgi:hypothetical protein